MKKWAGENNVELFEDMDKYDGLTLCAGSHIVVWIHEKTANPVSIAIHEAVHVFQKLCHLISETEPSDEFEAYTIAHIATTLLERKAYYALHDERKARLQKGKPLVQLEAGTNQSPLGTDSYEAGL